MPPGQHVSWWRHQMETFSALLALCAGKSPVTGEFPAQRPVTRGFDVFFDLRLNKRFSKQWWGWWFETPSRPLWHNCNVLEYIAGAAGLCVAAERWGQGWEKLSVIASWYDNSVLLTLCVGNLPITGDYIHANDITHFAQHCLPLITFTNTQYMHLLGPIDTYIHQ